MKSTSKRLTIIINIITKKFTSTHHLGLGGVLCAGKDLGGVACAHDLLHFGASNVDAGDVGVDG